MHCREASGQADAGCLAAAVLYDGLLTYLAIGQPRLSCRDQNLSWTVRRRGRPRESAMRRLYYRDSYGRVRRDRKSEGRQGIPARFLATALMVLAAIVVLASLIP